MAPSQLDITGSFAGEVSVKPEEHPAERAARLRSEQRQALLEDIKNTVLFACFLGAVLILGGLSAYEGIFDAGASTDTKRWAQTILSSLMAGAVAFVIGRKNK